MSLEDLIEELSDDDDRDADLAAVEAAGATRAILQRYEAEGRFGAAFAIEVSPGTAADLAAHLHGQTLDTDDPDVQAVNLPVGIPNALGARVDGTVSGSPVAGTVVFVADETHLWGIQAAAEGSDALESEVVAAIEAVQARLGEGGASASDAFPDPGEEALLDHVPTEAQVGCERTSDTARAAGASSSVRCAPEDGLLVYYEAFPSDQAMADSYDSYLQGNDIERGEGTTCERGAPAEGTWQEGRVVCWERDGTAWMAWTYDDLRIVTVAVEQGGDLPRLVEWWASPASGPVS